MPTENNKSKDICHTIHTADSVDPFEGLDLSEICVAPAQKGQEPDETNNQESQEGGGLFDLNPLDGIDLQGISLSPEVVSGNDAGSISKKRFHDSGHIANDTPQEQGVATEPDIEDSLGSDTFSKSTEGALPPQKILTTPIHPLIEKAYHYAELTQIRQKIFDGLAQKNGKTVLTASPLDNTGSSLLAAALAYNAACSCQYNVLLIDCNMRRAGLHTFFSVPLSYGFTDLVRNNLPWQAVVKDISIEGLSIITAGEPIDNFSDYLRYAHIPDLVTAVKDSYDLIIFDTSPILKPNRNNVNIVSLTAVVDYFLLITKQTGTTKELLKETKEIVEAGSGQIDGIVINEHTPSSQPVPYK